MLITIFEKPISNAPVVKLHNGKKCIPQQYLLYKHTLESVQRVVYKIEFDLRFPIFVNERDNGIIIQIGIIGADNYNKPPYESTSCIEQKIVYGRKWRVEKELPTSEVIQTVFLALKLAREHEVRELFRLTSGGRITTPFNNHHDLPLMAHNSDLLLRQVHELQHDQMAASINTIEYDKAKFELLQINNIREGIWLIELKVKNTGKSTLNELKEGMLIPLMVVNLSFNELCHALIEKLIALSNQYVGEHFRYNGFARFSRDVCVAAIADLSSVVRKSFGDTQSGLHYTMTQINYDVDQTRIPLLDNSELSKKIYNNLASFGELAGMPSYLKNSKT